MKNKILGVFIMAEGQPDSQQANMLGMGIMMEFKFKGGLDWDGAARTAFGADIGAYDSEEHAMCAFIEQDGYRNLLTRDNTAVFWHDTTYTSLNVYCCVIVNGKYQSFPDCQTVFGKYVGKAASRASSPKSGSSADPLASLPAGCRKYIEEGDRLHKMGKIEEAIVAYGNAYDLKKGNLHLGTKLVGEMLQSKDIKQREMGFYVVMQVAQLDTSNTMKGDYYVLLAKSLYAYIKDKNEAKLDADLASIGTTTRKYLTSAISDARYLGTDVPEFKEMDAALEQGTKKGSFFRRNR